MSEPQSMQFDRAEFQSGSGAATPCAQCRRPLIQSYYEVGGHLICAQCRDALSVGANTGGGRQFLRSLAAGLGVAVAGAAVWWGVRTYMHLEAGIISIGIAFVVAKAIRWGTFGRGGRGYQVLAVLLTYLAVALNYTPDVYNSMRSSSAAALIVAFVVALAVPFLSGLGNIIGIVIIGFGLFEAWKLTARRELTITGPFSVAPAAPAPQPNV